MKHKTPTLEEEIIDLIVQHRVNPIKLGARECAKHIIKMMESERDKIWEKCFDIMFDLTQSHDCSKDTACKFEDRAFGALRKMEKIK